MRGIGTFAVVVVVGLSSGCDAAAPPRSTSTIRDSAGVRIIESLADGRFRAPWVVGLEVWTIGELDGPADYLLSRVQGAMQLPTGEVVIANGGTNELRFYGPDGTHRRTLGREGQGPGEFEYLRALGPCREDGFVAFDFNWQMNVYGFDGTFVEKTVLRTPDGITPYEVACDGDGHVLLLGWGRDASEGPREGFYQLHDDLLLTNADGEIDTDFGRRLVSERIGSRFGSRPHPGGRATVFALRDHLVYVGSGERFEVEVWALDGSLQSLLRGPPVSLQVSDSVKNVFVESALSRISEERRPAARTDFASWEWPESLPAYTALQVDPEGVVWVRIYNPDPSAPELWSLLHVTDGYLGDLALGARQTLLEAGDDYVLVLSRDEFDVERVAKHTLNRSGSESPR